MIAQRQKPRRRSLAPRPMSSAHAFASESRRRHDLARKPRALIDFAAHGSYHLIRTGSSMPRWSTIGATGGSTLRSAGGLNLTGPTELLDRVERFRPPGGRGGSAQHPPAQLLRTVTWNVARRSSRLAEQAALLALREPDVVALQEIAYRTRPLCRGSVCLNAPAPPEGAPGKRCCRVLHLATRPGS